MSQSNPRNPQSSIPDLKSSISNPQSEIFNHKSSIVPPLVSILMVNFNGTDDTIECLESLKKCTYPNFEVRILDNGSQPDQVEKLQEYIDELQRDNLLPVTCYLSLSPTNTGFGVGNNILLRQVLNQQSEQNTSETKNQKLKTKNSPQYVYFLNNDTEVDPDFLTHAVALAEASSLNKSSIGNRQSSIGIVNSLSILYYERDKVENAGHLLLDCGDSTYRGRGEAVSNYLKYSFPLEKGKSLSSSSSGMAEGRMELMHQATDYRLPTTNLLGACSAAVLYRVDMLRECGLYDEHFFLNYEDADLSLRCILYGWRIALEPKSIVYHKVNRSITKVKNEEFFIRSQYNQFKSYYHNIPTAVLIANLPFVILRDLFVIVANTIFMRKTILKVFLNAHWKMLRNIRSIWAVRRENMRHQKTSSWYFLKHQKNFLPVYFRYFYDIIVKKNRSIFETKATETTPFIKGSTDRTVGGFENQDIKNSDQ